MKLPCSKCGKLFDVPNPSSVMNLCPSCKNEDMLMAMGTAPDFLTEIMNQFR